MKKLALNITLVLGLLFTVVSEALAVGAIPTPVTVRQPDGSVVTVRIHGDEFLNWMTCGNSIVEIGSDGYLHYATIQADGKKVLGGRYSSNGALFSSGATPTPPAAAVANAQIKREQFFSSFPSKAAQRSISMGEKKFLVILVEFTDKKFSSTNPQTAFSDMLNKEGYSENEGTGSVKDYYVANSLGKFTPEYVVAGPVKVSQSSTYYGANKGMDAYPKPGMPALLIEVCDSLAKKGFDFAPYDLDNDGTLENIFVYYAGHNSAEGATGTIWPHSWGVGSANKLYSGKLLNRYACSSELRGSSGTTMCGIGTFCHEFGHVLGLPDFYDTNYEVDGQGNGLRGFSLMSSGNYNNGGKTPPYFNIVERIYLNWKSEDDMIELQKSGDYKLEPVQLSGSCYMTPTNNYGEYYIYEFRNGEGWDTPLPKGFNIYHIDQSENDVKGTSALNRWKSGVINTVGLHQCFDLVASTPGAIYDDQVPFGDAVKSFTNTTDPAAKAWDGSITGYNLTNIAYTGTEATFTLEIFKSTTISGTVTDSEGNPVEGAEIVVSEYQAESPVATKAFSLNGTTLRMAPALVAKATAVTAKDGSYKVNVENLSGDNYTLTASKRGYISYTNNFSYKAGEVSIKPVLSLPGTGNRLSQSSLLSENRVGTSEGATLNAAQAMSASFLSGYENFTIEKIYFRVVGSTATSFKVMIYEDKTLVLEKDALADVKFGELSSTDISSYGLTIKPSKEYWVGYQISGCDYKYPLSLSGEYDVAGGCLVSTNMGNTWQDVTADYGTLNVAIEVSKPYKLWTDMNMAVLSGSEKEWKAGESYNFSINVPASGYKSIEWFFDGASKGASPAAVTLTAGEHTIKAVITYNNGLVETVTKVVKVQ